MRRKGSRSVFIKRVTSPQGDFGELSTCTVGDRNGAQMLSLTSHPFLPAFHLCLTKWETEKLSMPFNPDKFQISTFSLLFQLLIFQGRNN